MISLRRFLLSFLFLSLAVCPFLRAADDESQLTLSRLYDSGDFSSKGISARWIEGGYSRTESSKRDAGGVDIVRYDAESGERTVLVPAEDLIPHLESSPLRVEDHSWSPDRSMLLIYTNSKRVWRRNTRGDYWVLDRSSRELKQLGGDAKASTLMFAKFAPTGRRVSYVRENDIYVEDLADSKIIRLTKYGGDRFINGTFDWVYEEELGLRDGYRWSPDGTKIAYWQLDTSGVRIFPLINYTDGLYPKIREFQYPKVGEKNSAARVGVVSAEGGTTAWLPIPGDERNHYIARMNWLSSDEIVIQQLNRLQNTNRILVAAADAEKVETVFTDRDDAWLRVFSGLTWLRGGDRFTFLSERDGWSHLYVVSRSTGEAKLITPGDFDVTDVLSIDENENWIYFRASPENPTQRYLYRARLDGTKVERVTPLVGTQGTHSYQMSPKARYAIHRFSSFEQPTVTKLVRLPSHDVVRPLETNERLRERLAKLDRSPAEFFRIDIGVGVELDAWCIKPPKLDRNKKYPLLVYVYGEPAGQTVLDRWSSRSYLWHLMLAQRGYVVVSIDNRGTPSPRGREWRKMVYRQVGILAPKEQALAVKKLLADRPYLDAKRVGVWGWSGGGSMTLNALFKHPDLYHTGISIAPVPNQRFYDTIYQERYMGLPHDNVRGFREGSPITYASQLKGNLLLIHGTGDDNCHYQGAEALVDELIRHNLQFQMMAYPNRSHSIREGVNTTIHLRTLMYNFLLEKLPPGPK
ncbi:MAG: S9 family peptidase [Planctomycetota bacterium]